MKVGNGGNGGQFVLVPETMSEAAIISKLGNWFDGLDVRMISHTMIGPMPAEGFDFDNATPILIITEAPDGSELDEDEQKAEQL